MSRAKFILEAKRFFFGDFSPGSFLIVVDDFYLYDIISGQQIELVEDDILVVKEKELGTYYLALLDHLHHESLTMQVLSRVVHDSVKQGYLKDMNI